MLEPRSFNAYKNIAVLMIAMLGHSEVDTDMKTMRSKMLIVYWWQHEREQDFSTEMDRILSTHLSSQSLNCVGQASCIQRPKSRKNQVKLY